MGKPAALPLTPEGDLVLKLVPGQLASLTVDRNTGMVELEVEGCGLTQTYRGIVPRHIHIT